MENIQAFLVVLFLFCKPVESQISTFSNPVLDVTTRDTVVYRNAGNYYLVYADNSVGELHILKSPFLTDFRNAEKCVLGRRSAGYTSFHPSSFLEYQNDLYLYFHMQNQDVPWRMFVIKALNSENPMGLWSPPVRVLDYIWNNTAVHGIPVEIKNTLYFVWVGSPSSKWSIYIAKMKNPTEVLEPIVLLREPVEDWNCHLQAPSFLYNREKVYMIFTSCTQNTTTGTSLSTMSIELGLDPMVPSNWEVVTNSVFVGNQEENVYHVRYFEFTESPDGTETWMLYTSSSNMSDINPTSRVRIEKVNWNNSDGSPVFPLAMANGYQQQLPSGEPVKIYNPVSGNFISYTNAHRVGNNYFAVTKVDRDLFVVKSDKLYDFANVEKSEVLYTAPEGLTVGAGRIFELDEEAYLYFSIHNSTHDFLHVLKAENKSDLMQNWGTPTRLLDGVLDGLGFHPTIFQQNNSNYLVYDHKNNGSWVIYIAPMQSPTQVVEPAVLLREPKQIWECYGSCVTYNPSFVYHYNTAFMFFTTSYGWSHIDASVSYMTIASGKDPLDVTNWYSAPTPVFNTNDAESVYGVANVWFTTSPDGLENWMMYSASNNSTNTGVGRNIRIQKISWDDETQHPVLPMARGLSYSSAIPTSFSYFTNPIADDASISPGINRIGNFYYMLLSSKDGTELELLNSGKLENFRNADRKTIYRVPDGYSISGSSRMHKVDGNLYAYFSMETQSTKSQMFALQAHDPSNPMGLWDSNPIFLAPSWNYPAFQATVLEHGENSYLVWVSLHATGFNSIFIAQMLNATHVVEPFNLIRHPMELWECEGACSNEAPYIIYNLETAYMVLSVGAACKGGNGLTYMSISKDKDPMNIVNWSKAPGKVFSENREENVLCPAHATFTVSPDEKETWMVYHASDSAHPDAVRTARIEKISWDSDTGEPILPEPHGFYHEQVIPSRI